MGTVTLAIAAAAGVAVVIAVPILVLRQTGWPLINTILQVSILAGVVLHVPGAWMFTSAEPQRNREHDALIARWFIRGALCVVAVVFVMAIFRPRTLFPTRVLASAAWWLAFFAASGALVAIARRVEQLAARMPDPWLANQAQCLKWAIAIFAGAGVLFAVLLSFSRGGGDFIGALCYAILLWVGLLTLSLIYLGTLAALAVALRTEHREAIRLRDAPADLRSRR